MLFRRRPGRFSLGSSIVFAALVAACPATATGNPARSHPATSGFWLRRVDDHALYCKTASNVLLWSWSEDNGSSLNLRDPTGKLLSAAPWKVGYPIQKPAPSDDCKTVWMISRDGGHLFSVNAERDSNGNPKGLLTASIDELAAVLPFGDGQTAWIVPRSEPSLWQAARSNTGLSLRHVASSGLKSSLRQVELIGSGKKVWVVPQSSHGLWMGDVGGIHSCCALESKDINGISLSNDGLIAWALGTKEDPTVSVVDDKGKRVGSVPLSSPVAEVFGGRNKRVVWIKTMHEQVYLARAVLSPAGAKIQLLNNKEPVGGSSDPLRFEALAITGDGHQAWALPPARSQKDGLWNDLWFLAVSADGMSVSQTRIDPRLYDQKPLRMVWGDEIDLSHAWVQTNDLSIYSLYNGKPQSTVVLDFAASSILVDWIASPGQPGSQLLLPSRGAYLSGQSANLIKAEVSFAGGGGLDLSTVSPLQLRPPGSKATVHLGWAEGSAPAGNSPGVHLRFFRGETKIREFTSHLTPDGATAVLDLTEPGEKLPADAPLDIQLVYRDKTGSAVCGFRRRRPPIPTEGDHSSERGDERRLMVG